ncbi:MAG: signal peptidase I [Candidatus Spechtbacteria bacterium RIFCSPHIGHO2_02_FULL_43_15b]|uniref:Signal peptidase I n=1 Tax=Candidatus Spechtbacteria bacterium RIFCSPHIGHO2_01_FULL_43_30 TaxID=1802158 RepID=A0A1G2H8I0_9BACT|nr:MAG: signal peptidase I [Candidatus Spechtbacteria bacterium RIFCSPHIGHO2_01_FULL_43_30]OGZ59774.1 MAG: signal peptidase I [Candidatus Spechtbacteria bacterium RIFCSPHIGHO2_02_FULL_43_15b]
MSLIKSSTSFLWEIFKIVLISLAIIVPIRYFVMQPFFVRGASMEPNFKGGDYLIINEIGYHFGQPQRGDVVVFRPPQNTSQFYIKRIIGMPGEVISIKGGSVWVGQDHNSLKLLEEEYLHEVTQGDMEAILGIDEYFVLGDNRNSSSDSRSWGSVKRGAIIGKAWIRAWPFDSFEIIKEPEY